jgi:hypothetical protein
VGEKSGRDWLVDPAESLLAAELTSAGPVDAGVCTAGWPGGGSCMSLLSGMRTLFGAEVDSEGVNVWMLLVSPALSADHSQVYVEASLLIGTVDTARSIVDLPASPLPVPFPL